MKRKVLLLSHLRTCARNCFLRKGAKKTPRNAVALCVFAPLREKSSSHKALFVQSRDLQ